MVRNDTNQIDVLDAVVRRLIDQIDTLSDKNCFLAVLPDGTPYRPADDVFVVVSPTGGRFGLVDGGGIRQVNEQTGVLVTIFSRFMATRQERDRDALADQTRGLLVLKGRILRAMAALDLEVSGQPALRDLLVPTESTPPDPAHGDERLVQIGLKFEFSYDWDLS